MRSLSSKFQVPSSAPRVSRGGYTIIELLVVVAITAFLASFVFSYGKSGRQQVSLMLERAKIAQMIFHARSLAVSTYNKPSPPCAYGVYFDYGAKAYDLASYSASPCSSIANASAARSVLETYPLDPLVVYGAGSSPVSDVLFFPPDPTTVVFVSSNTTSTDGTVYLSASSGSGAASISINSAGQVSF